MSSATKGAFGPSVVGTFGPAHAGRRMATMAPGVDRRLVQEEEPRAGEVKWQPAVDPNRLFAVVGAVLIAFLLTRPRVARARARAAHHAEKR
ncbi:MAG TPA: hypothetical protein VFM07_01250 [Intrasporangium sp.]|nr:hypothetical protein [Intrasporangium sp.]